MVRIVAELVAIGIRNAAQAVARPVADPQAVVAAEDGAEDAGQSGGLRAGLVHRPVAPIVVGVAVVRVGIAIIILVVAQAGVAGTAVSRAHLLARIADLLLELAPF